MFLELPMILYLFQNNIGHISDGSQPLATRHSSIMTLTVTCADNKLNQLEFGERGGVGAIIPYLKYSPTEPVRKEDVVVAALVNIFFISQR